jgi:hypothetical protein
MGEKKMKNRKLLWIGALLFLLIFSLCMLGACTGEKKVTGECKISIVCHTAAEKKDEGKLKETVGKAVPDDGVILEETAVVIHQGDTAVDVLRGATRQKEIQMSVKGSGKTAYVEGINNLYEFHCGGKSGWMFRVNGEFPDVGPAKYLIKDKDVIVWEYTCNGGKDL